MCVVGQPELHYMTRRQYSVCHTYIYAPNCSIDVHISAQAGKCVANNWISLKRVLILFVSAVRQPPKANSHKVGDTRSIGCLWSGSWGR